MKTNAKREGDSGMHKVLIISEGVLKRYKWLRLSAGSSGRPIALPWSLSPATPRNARSVTGQLPLRSFALASLSGNLRVALGPGDRAALYAAFTSYGRRPLRRKSLRDRQRAGAIGQRYRRRRPQKFTTESDHGHCPHLAGFVWDAAAGPTELLILDCDETTTEALSR